MKKKDIKKKLIELYELYHFQLEKELENILVFSYSIGYFHNADIILLEEDDKCRELAKDIEVEYKEIEYNQVFTSYYESVQRTHDKLFKGFFSLRDSQKHLKLEYKEFCKKKSEKLLDKYVYIPCRYRNSRGEECTDLVDNVVKSAEIRQARLTILEAAAGYGKTCTAYEILNTFLNKQEEKIPLFIELSKNRTARIFRHVLYDEIDRKFTQLSYKTVIQEIKCGRLPLIIDGFDELIEQKEEKVVKSKEGEIDERSLTLLSTITELLGDDSNAWVLLTTRQSAIFTGDIFEEWMFSHLGKQCIVDRMQIQLPSFKEWINSEKYALIQKSNFDMENVANPVLLTFIRNAKKEELEKMIQTSDTILDKYFDLLLTRELERQNLEFTKKELHTVMKQLAAEFAKFDMKSETIEFIQELLHDILREDLLRYRTRYREKHLTEEGILSADEFVKRVSHNYLLDRISANSNQIGFINEFIFGILVGDAVREGILENKYLYERFIDMSVTAFAVREMKIREDYYDKIKNHLVQVSDICRLNAEMCLLHKVNCNYEEGYFRSFYFKKNFYFSLPHKFVDCTFDTCTFDGCSIQAEVFVDCKFVNCQFYNVNIEGRPNQNLVFMGCSGYEKLESSQVLLENDTDVDYYEKLVLEQFWKSGYESAELRRTYTALFRGIKNNERMYVQNAINSLLKRGLILELNVCYELNTAYMGEINHILGRREKRFT